MHACLRLQVHVLEIDINCTGFYCQLFAKIDNSQKKEKMNIHWFYSFFF
jgi:hypothetical protein